MFEPANHWLCKTQNVSENDVNENFCAILNDFVYIKVIHMLMYVGTC